MKDFVTKVNSTTPPTGDLTADEFNNFIDELENFITKTGQTLDVPTNTLRQMIQALAVGGERVSRTDTEIAQLGEIVLPDNSSASLTIHLPNTNLFINAVVYFEQVDDQPYSTFGLTVGRNGNKIMSLEQDMTVNLIASDNVKFKMTWKGGSVGWVVSQTEIVGSTS